ncbi:MAG: HmuY family protein [Pseudomonadota bacterium]
MKTLIVAACVLVACSSSPLESTSAGGAANGGNADASATAGASGTAAAFVDNCSAARAQLLGASEMVSTETVQVLANTAGVKTLYVDATAGGQNGAPTHPWTFIALGDGTKTDVNDVTSLQSSAWDLAFKRDLIYTNGGEGGPGKGGSVFLDKDFADVTSADLVGADFVTEEFFDDDCNPIVDVTGAASTSFSSWYDYDETTHVLSPVTGTWLVRGATGKFFKLRFESYYATPNGGTGSAGGAYLLEIGAF